MPLVGSFRNTFVFTERGGRGNLAPGRPLEGRVNFASSVPALPGVAWHVNFRGFQSGFIHTNRPLRLFNITVGLTGPGLTTLVCRVRLTDDNMDDAIHIRVFASVLFFT